MAFTTQSNHYFSSNSSFIRIELIITSQRINHQAFYFFVYLLFGRYIFFGYFCS